MADDARYILLNGAIQRAEKAAVLAGSRGLMYGDGCFETFCAYNGAFFKLQEHLDRLAEGLKYLGIAYPLELRYQKVKLLLQKLLTENKLLNEKAIIRLQVWRSGSRGYASSSQESDYMITAAMHSGSKTSYHLTTVATRRIPSAALPSRYKLTNSINYILAANEAKSQGGDDALMQTTNGWISETTIANIFWFKDNTLYTPSENCDILPGVTRRVVLGLLQDGMNMKVEQGQYAVEAVKNAEAAWICNSVKEVAAVSRIDDTTFNCNTAIFGELRKRMTELISSISKGKA